MAPAQGTSQAAPKPTRRRWAIICTALALPLAAILWGIHSAPMLLRAAAALPQYPILTRLALQRLPGIPPYTHCQISYDTKKRQYTVTLCDGDLTILLILDHEGAILTRTTQQATPSIGSARTA